MADTLLIVKKRFVQLMVPFFMWSLIKAIYVTDYNLIWHSILYPANSLWFLWALFFICVIYSLIVRVALFFQFNKKMCCLVAFIFLFILAAFSRDLFYMTGIAKYFLFYCIGVFVRKHDDILYDTKIPYLYLIAYLISAFWWKMGASPIFVSSPIISELCGFGYNLLTGLLGSMACILLFKRFTFDNGVVSWIGQNTLGVYAVQFFIIDICKVVYSRQSVSFIPIYLIVILVLCYIAITIFKKTKTTQFLLLGSH
jgi:fucose 4-O-acetylase-like acetyltransferase